MPYEIIQPPFTLLFDEMPKRELKAHFEWFVAQIPIRIRILESAVRETKGFEGWIADFEENSLARLGEWYASQVETRLRTEEEKVEIAQGGSFPITIPEDILTNKTFSLAIDIAMYTGEILRKQFPNLTWGLMLKGGKSNIDYGKPVIMGVGKVPIEPVGIMQVIAWGVLRKKETGRSLSEIYTQWANEARATLEA